MEERLAQLEKRGARLEGQAQAQPETSESHTFRLFVADVTKKLESGEMTLNEARKAFGLEPLAVPAAIDGEAIDVGPSL